MAGSEIECPDCDGEGEVEHPHLQLWKEKVDVYR